MKIHLDDVALEQVDKLSEMLADPNYKRDDVDAISVMIAAKVLGAVRYRRAMETKVVAV